MKSRPLFLSLSLSLLLVFLTANHSLAQDAGNSPALNKALQSELARMTETDQKHRAELQEHMKKQSPGTATMSAEDLKALWDKQAEIDRQNMRRLEEIIKEHGWPGKSLVGKEGALAAFLIVQHADLEVQKRYFPLLKEAVAKGEADADDAAMLEDRILMSEGKKQIYGTQLRTVEGKLELYPIDDEENVDARRAAVGLPPLAEYLKHFGLEYKPLGKKK